MKKLKEHNIKIVLASSADRRKIESNLKAAKIDSDIFDAIVSGDDVGKKKPNPDIYLYAADKINEKPENCIVVEDALNGIIAAKTAGMKCIALDTSFDKEELESENPDYICSDLNMVYDYIMVL